MRRDGEYIFTRLRRADEQTGKEVVVFAVAPENLPAAPVAVGFDFHGAADKAVGSISHYGEMGSQMIFQYGWKT